MALFERLPSWLTIGLLSVLCSLANQSMASSKDPGKVIAGWIEKVSFSDLPGPTGFFKAKLDTGAETSSIHAENIDFIKREGKTWVKFDLIVEDADGKEQNVSLLKKRKRNIRIKEHHGKPDRRAVVELQFCFDGRYHTSQFSLADRSEFLYPVLLGRRFLQEVAVVDPAATFLTLAHCTEATPPKPKHQKPK